MRIAATCRHKNRYDWHDWYDWYDWYGWSVLFVQDKRWEPPPAMTPLTWPPGLADLPVGCSRAASIGAARQTARRFLAGSGMRRVTVVCRRQFRSAVPRPLPRRCHPSHCTYRMFSYLPTTALADKYAGP